MAWFESKQAWYRYWDGPEMVEFRRRRSGKYQIPIAYAWYDELVVGALGPEVGARAGARATAGAGAAGGRLTTARVSR